MKLLRPHIVPRVPMPHLRVLGSVRVLTASGEEAGSVTAQPKRAALLAYLAFASHDGPIRRDTLLALFWPELDTAHARHALRQSLYYLRHELGPDIIQMNGDEELRIRAELLQCDVCEFRVAVASGSHARALDLYRGDLLPGLYISGAPEFEQWLESTRALLRSQALEAALALCQEAERAGRHADAARWAQRALLLAPFDESVLRRLLAALEVAGDYSNAVLVFEAFVARCRRDLDVAPSAETAAIIERMRERPPQRRPPRLPVAAEAEPGDGDSPAPLAAGPGRPRWRGAWPWRPRWGVVLATILLIAGMTAAWRALEARPKLDATLLAVLPFRVVGPAADSLVLSEGIADLLSIALQSSPEARLVSQRVTAARWRSATDAGRDRRDPALARQLARGLGAGLVLHGSAFQIHDEIIVAATLEDVQRGSLVGNATVRGPAVELTRLLDQLATRAVGAVLREDPLRLELLTSTSFPAVREYLAGRAAARQGAYAEALRHFDRALELDSAFAAAALAAVDVAGWSGLAPMGRYEQLAYAHRDRLTPRDTAYLRAWIGYLADSAGRSHGSDTGRGTARDLFEASERTATALPDQPDALYILGDRYFHIGAYLGLEDSPGRARALFMRALALDSGFAPAREHLVELAVITGNRRDARRHRDHAVIAEPGGLRTPYQRWLAAAFLGDGREQRRMRGALDTMNANSLRLIVNFAQELGVGLRDAEAAAQALLARAGTEEERERAKTMLAHLYLNLGRPRAADRVRTNRDIGATTTRTELQQLAQQTWFHDAPPSAARAALAELERRAAMTPGNDKERQSQEAALAVALTWRLWEGDTAGAALEADRLRSSLQARWPSGDRLVEREVRLAVVLALLEHHRLRRHAAAARPYLEQLDSLARMGAGPAPMANAVLVRLFTELEQPDRALAASRRRLRSFTAWLAPMLLQEARLAARVGDVDGAAAAYRHYLVLRHDPEPQLRPLADSARTEYRQLPGR